MRWRLPGTLGLASFALLIASDARADPAPSLAISTDSDVWRPSHEARIRRLVPLALLRGRVGVLPIVDADVVIALDQSSSALLASGVDVDRDGSVGRTRSWARDGGGYGRPHREWTTDRGDTVLAAELALARSAIADLGALGNRIGLLTFTDAVRVRASVGNPSAASAALEGVRPLDDWTGTNLARALEISAGLLAAAAPGSGEGRRRAILLLSDGRPNAPDGEHWARQRAREAAARFGALGFGVFSVAIGEEADAGFLEELAALSGGSRLSFDQLRALASAAGRSELVPKQLVIENLTAKAPARALRVFSDGGFEALVPLTEGENALEVTAVFADGQRTVTRSVVHYERPDPATDEDRREAARWLELLRERTREIEH